MIMFIPFLVILLLSFGVMAFATKPSEGQQAIERRIIDIRSTRVETSSGGAEMGQLLKIEPTSSFGWLENVLQKYQISHLLETRIAQANSKITVARLLLSCLGAGVAGFVICSLFISLLAIQLVVACALAYVPFAVISVKRSRRLAAFNKALPDAIDMMGRGLRAGHSMVAAINIVAEQGVEPVSSEFSEVFKQQNFGLPLRDALNQMLDRVPSPDLRVVVTGILVQKDTGGNLAEILDRTVTVIRERMRIQGEIKTHTAQGRMTGYILCSLPIVMLIVINLVNPGYSKILLDTPLGHKLIYIGLFLLTTGGLIIRQIINGIEV
jgi:tight adherence protein B